MTKRVMSIKTGILSIITGLLILSVQSCCNNKSPYEIAAVTVRFEGLNDVDMARAWVIETEQDNPGINIDSVFYGVMNQSNNFSFLLEFNRSALNGDFYIHADSIQGQNVITDVAVTVEERKCKADILDYTYSFNGVPKSEKDREIVIAK